MNTLLPCKWTVPSTIGKMIGQEIPSDTDPYYAYNYIDKGDKSGWVVLDLASP